MPDDLSTTLLIVPCCAGKRGWHGPTLPARQVSDLVGLDAANLLEEGRRLAFDRTHLERAASPRAALHTYTGYPYATPGFRELLIGHLRRGLHCLIVSGGYGLLRPEEPIQPYDAHLQHTRAIWRRRVPDILRDYVRRNGIERTFGIFSGGYGVVVPSDLTAADYRAVQVHDRERDAGAARQAVPRKVGHALVALLLAEYRISDAAVGVARPSGARSPTADVAATGGDGEGIAGRAAPTQGQAAADAVRRFLIETYIEPARATCQTTVGPLRAGDVHRAMGLKGRMPQICSVMDSRKFHEEAGVDLVDRTGPLQSSTATFQYRLR